MHFIQYFFNWYHGQFWPNLFADIGCTALLAAWGWRKFVKLHKRHQVALHNHISNEFAKLTEKINT